MNSPLGGVSPSKGNQGTARGKEKISTSVGGNGRSNPEVVGSNPTEVSLPRVVP